MTTNPTYALDINNQRIKRAMIELGVDANELILRRREDFQEPNIS